MRFVTTYYFVVSLKAFIDVYTYKKRLRKFKKLSDKIGVVH